MTLLQEHETFRNQIRKSETKCDKSHTTDRRIDPGISKDYGS